MSGPVVSDWILGVELEVELWGSASRGDAQERAAEHAPQVVLYAEGLRAALGKPVLGCYLHFPVIGACVAVDPG